MGQPLTPLTGEATRKALTPGQTGPAGDRDAVSSRAPLDEQELQDLEAVELYGTDPVP